MSADEAVAAIVSTAANDFEAREGYFILEKDAMKELVGLEEGIKILQAFDKRVTELGKAVNFTLEEIVQQEVDCYKISWTPVDVRK